MVKFGPLTAEIGSGVWGTPTNFNGFCVLAALLDDTLVVGVSQTAALNRGRYLCSAGRPSGWALAHILVELFLLALTVETLQSEICRRERFLKAGDFRLPIWCLRAHVCVPEDPRVDGTRLFHHESGAG